MQTISDDMFLRLADLLVLRPSPPPWRIVADGTLAGPCLPMRVGPRGRVLPALGLVGLGMLLVGGFVLTVSPRMRAQIRARLQRAPHDQAQRAR